MTPCPEINAFPRARRLSKTPGGSQQHDQEQFLKMGQHTIFISSGALLMERLQLYVEIEKSLKGFGEYLYEEDIMQREERIMEIECSYRTAYNDSFRTHMREADGSYLEKIIWSEEECWHWLQENREKVYHLNKRRVGRFWDEYPEGAIYFG